MSSYRIIELLSIGKPDAPWICLVTDRNYLHSLLASWREITSTWFEEVATGVCFCDLHDIAVLPYVNIYPVCDLALCGSDKYSASA